MANHMTIFRRRGPKHYTFAPLILITPNVLLFALFFVWPAAIGLVYSFTNYTGFGHPSFIGLANYIQLFHSPAFTDALLRTLLFAALVVPLTVVLSLLLATLLVSKYAKGKTIPRIVFFMPWLISPIVNGLLWRWLFGQDFGYVNYIIQQLGGHAVAWQDNGDLALLVLVLAESWAGTAFSMLLFIAALKNIPRVYYEAAAIDGATYWMRFRKVTLPLIRTTTFIVVLLASIGCMQEYPLILAFNNGGPITANNLMVQYIYDTGFDYGKFGYGSAVSFVLLLILMVLAFIQIAINRRREVRV